MSLHCIFIFQLFHQQLQKHIDHTVPIGRKRFAIIRYFVLSDLSIVSFHCICIFQSSNLFLSTLIKGPGPVGDERRRKGQVGRQRRNQGQEVGDDINDLRRHRHPRRGVARLDQRPLQLGEGWTEPLVAAGQPIQHQRRHRQLRVQRRDGHEFPGETSPARGQRA